MFYRFNGKCRKVYLSCWIIALEKIMRLQYFSTRGSAKTFYSIINIARDIVINSRIINYEYTLFRRRKNVFKYFVWFTIKQPLLILFCIIVLRAVIIMLKNSICRQIYCNVIIIVIITYHYHENSWFVQ